MRRVSLCSRPRPWRRCNEYLRGEETIVFTGPVEQVESSSRSDDSAGIELRIRAIRFWSRGRASRSVAYA